MNILVLNCGSSSAKYKLIEIKENKTLAEGGVEKIGLPDGFIKLKFDDGSKKNIDLGLTDHKGAIKAILDALINPEYGCIKDLKEIDAVGHRVVHGGEKFSRSVLITDEVKDMIRECYGIAPLHNPVNMAGIEAIEAVLPGVPQVAVFDTAFHQTMPKSAFMYPLPMEYYTNDHVRRYGFHGTSHRFIAQRVCEMLDTTPEGKRIICCHIGNGASISAIKDGKSIDTTMGLTPTEGLMMGTRSGDVDPGALLFLMDLKVGHAVERIQESAEIVLVEADGHGVDGEVAPVLVVLQSAVLNHGLAAVAVVRLAPRAHKLDLDAFVTDHGGAESAVVFGFLVAGQV